LRSAGVAQASTNAVDRSRDGAIEFSRVGFAVRNRRALTADQFDLDQAHGVHVRIAQAYGAVEDGVGFEQRLLPGDLEDHAVSEVELGFEGRKDAFAQALVLDEGSVETGNAEVGFSKGHLDVANDVKEEWEIAGHGLKLGQAVGILFNEEVECVPDAEVRGDQLT
jgi:hypothetical protein